MCYNNVSFLCICNVVGLVSVHVLFIIQVLKVRSAHNYVISDMVRHDDKLVSHSVTCVLQEDKKQGLL